MFRYYLYVEFDCVQCKKEVLQKRIRTKYRASTPTVSNNTAAVAPTTTVATTTTSFLSLPSVTVKREQTTKTGILEAARSVLVTVAAPVINASSVNVETTKMTNTGSTITYRRLPPQQKREQQEEDEEEEEEEGRLGNSSSTTNINTTTATTTPVTTTPNNPQTYYYHRMKNQSNWFVPLIGYTVHHEGQFSSKQHVFTYNNSFLWHITEYMINLVRNEVLAKGLNLKTVRAFTKSRPLNHGFHFWFEINIGECQNPIYALNHIFFICTKSTGNKFFPLMIDANCTPVRFYVVEPNKSYDIFLEIRQENVEVAKITLG